MIIIPDLAPYDHHHATLVNARQILYNLQSTYAGVAQLLERFLAMEEVQG